MINNDDFSNLEIHFVIDSNSQKRGFMKNPPIVFLMTHLLSVYLMANIAKLYSTNE